MVFHQKWNILTDQVTPGLNFNINSKNRGVSKGCNLIEMTNDEIIKVKITKTLIARLLGQIYDLSGLLSPARAALLSLFSKACQLLKDWKSALPPENEISMNVTSILCELAADIPNIQPFSRCKIPDGAELQRIVVFSDASLDIVAFAVYLDVRNADNTSSSNFLFANSYSRHASIPSLELLAFVIALNELHALVLKHSDSLLPSSKTVRVEFKLDSVCTLHSLNVNKLSKSILVKNAKDKMVCNLSQLSKGFDLLIYIWFTSTDTQAADLATKYYEGLIATVNSHLWRHGSADQVIPLLDAETIYLFTHKGSVTWAGKLEPKCNLLNCHDYDFCECQSCDTVFWTSYKTLFFGDLIGPEHGKYGENCHLKRLACKCNSEKLHHTLSLIHI